MRVLLLCAACALFCAAPAVAQLNGQTVTAEWRYPDFNSILESHNVVVGGGVELTPADILSDDKFSIDLGNDTVLFSFNAQSNWTAVAFNGWRFADTNGTIPKIIGYKIDSLSAGVTGLTDAALGFDDNAVWGNFAGVNVAGNGDFIQLKISFVPEPGTLALLALGVLGLRRR
jgi:hypothetical protein